MVKFSDDLNKMLIISLQGCLKWKFHTKRSNRHMSCVIIIDTSFTLRNLTLTRLPWTKLKDKTEFRVASTLFRLRLLEFCFTGNELTGKLIRHFSWDELLILTTLLHKSNVRLQWKRLIFTSKQHWEVTKSSSWSTQVVSGTFDI